MTTQLTFANSGYARHFPQYQKWHTSYDAAADYAMNLLAQYARAGHNSGLITPVIETHGTP